MRPFSKMRRKTRFFFILFVAIFADVYSQSEPVTVVTVGCKAFYTFNRSVINATISNSLVGIFERVTRNIYPTVLTLPANRSTLMNIEWTNSTGTYNLRSTQKTAEKCCSDNIFVSESCYKVNITCPEKCMVIVWPNIINFYKASFCDNCSCTYCFMGGKPIQQQLWIPLNLNHSQMVQINVSKFYERRSVSITEKYSIVQNSLQLNVTPSWDILPFPVQSLAERYFQVIPLKQNYDLRPKLGANIPKNGKMTIYFQRKTSDPNNAAIMEYNIRWYSQLQCTFKGLPVLYLNYPLMKMDCNKTDDLKIIYSIDNPNFQMIGNLVYFKELTTNGLIEMTVTAMIENITESGFTLKSKFSLNANKRFASVYGCKADINFQFLNYTKLLVLADGSQKTFSNRPNSSIFDLPPNKTTTLELYFNDRKQRFTITLQSADTCCQEILTKLNTSLCLRLGFACSKSCEVGTWPIVQDFYKESYCRNSCSCEYCYTGQEVGVKKIYVPLTSYNHQFQVNIPNIQESFEELIYQRNDFMTLIKLSQNTSFTYISLPGYTNFDDNFEFIFRNKSYFLNVKNKTTFPPNGRVEIYIYPQETKTQLNGIRKKLVLIWYTSPECKTTNLPFRYLNEPFLTVNCENSTGFQIEYSISSNLWKLKDNLLYLENLSKYSSDTVSISAMFSAKPESLVQIKNFTAPRVDYSLITIDDKCVMNVNFTLLNYKNLTFYLQNPDRYSRSLFNRPDSFKITLNPKKENLLEFYFDEKKQPNRFTVSPGDCCTNQVTYNKNCYLINLNCSSSTLCPGSNWPKYTDFYKASECNNCSCNYCYIGNISMLYEMYIPFKSSIYNMTFNITRVEKSTIELMLWRQSLLTPFQLPGSTFLFALPRPRLLERYFNVRNIDGTFLLENIGNDSLPLNGEVKLYFQPIAFEKTAMRITEYKIVWVSSFKCKVLYQNASFGNQPILKVDCNNPMNRTILYNITNDQFQMKRNLLYLRDLSVHQPVNLSIGAMYKDLKSSLTILNVELSPQNYPYLLERPLLLQSGCEVNLTFFPYKKLQIINKDIGVNFSVNSLPPNFRLLPNRTSTFNFIMDNDINYRLSVSSPDVCCNVSSGPLVFDLCFKIKLSCPNSCPLSIWPNYTNLYKISECTDCNCTYCYIPNKSIQQQTISNSIPITKTTYYWERKMPIIVKTSRIIKVPRKELISGYNISYNNQGSQVTIQNLGDRFLAQGILKPELINESLYVQANASYSLPRNGQFQVHLSSSLQGKINLQEYTIIWYSPLLCNVTKLPWRKPVDPLLSFNCENYLKEPIFYYTFNSKFQLDNARLYLRDLSAHGSFNVSIRARYSSAKDSETEVIVLVTIKDISPIIQVYGCKLLVDLRSLNIGHRNIFKQSNTILSPFRFNETHATYVVPQNQTTLIYISPNNSALNFTYQVQTPETCCQMIMTSRLTCMSFVLPCYVPCIVNSSWPELPGLYKAIDCTECSCRYCSAWDSNFTAMMVPVQLRKSDYLLTYRTYYKINSVKVKKFTLNTKKIINGFSLNRNRTRYDVPVSLPFGSYLNISFNRFNETILQPLRNRTFPRSGRQKIYLTKLRSAYVIDIYDIAWYPSVECNITKTFTNLISPLLKIDCYKPNQNVIVFKLTNNKFRLVDNLLYLKDISTRGSFNFSIIATYEGLNDSTTVYNVSLTLEDSLDFLILSGCQLFVNLTKTNHDSLNVFSPALQYNTTFFRNSVNLSNQLISLPRNKTTEFYFKPNYQNLIFKYNAKSSEYCCKVNVKRRKSLSCHEIKLECPFPCSGIYPSTNNFINIYSQTMCSAIYCSRRNNAGKFLMMAPQKTHKDLFVIDSLNANVTFITLEFLIGSEGVQFPGINSLFNDTIWSEVYSQYFIVQNTRLVLKNATVPEGKFFITFKDSTSEWMMNIVRVYVFKKVNCSKFNGDQDRWPLPIFICKNALSLQLNYTVNHRSFQMTDNVLYMTSPPNRDIRLTFDVMYENLQKSRKVYETSISLKEYFMSVKINMNREMSSVVLERLRGLAIVYKVLRHGNTYDFVLYVASPVGVRKEFEKSFFSKKVEILEYYKPVDRLFIVNLTATQVGENRYNFTCHTNSSFKDVSFEWYWNDFRVQRGISSSIHNGFSQGSIVFDELNENDSGTVKCHVKKKGYISYQSFISVTMNRFPKVNLTTTSNLITSSTPVNVSCKFSSEYRSDETTKLVFEVNGQKKDKMEVSLSKATTVSCFGINYIGQGLRKTVKIAVAIGKKLCKSETYQKINWPKTVAGSIANAKCGEGYDGIVTRFCSLSGAWKSPDNSSCIKISILNAKTTLARVELGIDKDFDSAVESLVNATKESLKAVDIKETVDALQIASQITNQSQEVSSKQVKNFADIVSNLVEDDTKSSWEKLEEDEKLSASSVLKQMEEFGNIASKKINETVLVSTKNLLVEYTKVDIFEELKFPRFNAETENWKGNITSEVVIPSEILQSKFATNESVSMNAAVFKNIKNILPKSNDTNSTVNSYVLAISFGKPLNNLKDKISLTFSHLSPGFDNSSCNFWDFNINPELGGYWSNRGCTVAASNSTFTTCSCDHLTNFAILMNPVSAEQNEALSIITKIGCSISIAALLLTVIIYFIFWKYVTAQDVSKSQSVLLINLCISLIIAYFIFLFLVEGPREKSVCTAVAALIQYFFLVAFFTMLAEGIDMSIALTVVFTSKFTRLPWLLLSSWVCPAIIVGITLAATKTEGFGNEVFCWLTSERNVIWSFIGPALLILLINFVCVVLILKALMSAHLMVRESTKQRLKSGARAVIILTPFMGFTWIFGVFAVNEKLIVFQYIFTVLTSLQGLFVFLSYCVFNKQIRKNFCKREKTSQATSYKPALSTSGTKSTELNNSSKRDSLDESLRESLEIEYPTNSNQTLFTFYDNGLKKPITPYYVKSSVKNNRL